MCDPEKEKNYLMSWREDWNRFCRDALKVRLDREQQAIISSVQHNKMTAVASGTARGKDFVSACAAMCFMYLTPRFDREGNLSKNTKIAMTAPTGRQVTDIMIPEVSRLYRKAGFLPGRLLANGIRTNYEEITSKFLKFNSNYAPLSAIVKSILVSVSAMSKTGDTDVISFIILLK